MFSSDPRTAGISGRSFAVPLSLIAVLALAMPAGAGKKNPGSGTSSTDLSKIAVSGSSVNTKTGAQSNFSGSLEVLGITRDETNALTFTCLLNGVSGNGSGAVWIYDYTVSTKGTVTNPSTTTCGEVTINLEPLDLDLIDQSIDLADIQAIIASGRKTGSDPAAYLCDIAAATKSGNSGALDTALNGINPHLGHVMRPIPVTGVASGGQFTGYAIITSVHHDSVGNVSFCGGVNGWIHGGADTEMQPVVNQPFAVISSLTQTVPGSCDRLTLDLGQMRLVYPDTLIDLGPVILDLENNPSPGSLDDSLCQLAKSMAGGNHQHIQRSVDRVNAGLIE